MNRKGFLLGEETLKIIIAIICILVLVYFLISLYMANKGNKELEQAKASLEHLVSEINSGREQVEIYNPDGWYISSFPQTIEGGILPDYCSGRRWENCICICGVDIKKKAGKEKCDNLGTCLENEFIMGGGLSRNIMIEPPLILSIDYENKIISKKIGAEDEEGEASGGAGGG